MDNITHREYVSIKVPKELKDQIKEEAAKQSKTIIKLLEDDYGK